MMQEIGSQGRPKKTAEKSPLIQSLKMIVSADIIDMKDSNNDVGDDNDDSDKEDDDDDDDDN